MDGIHNQKYTQDGSDIVHQDSSQTVSLVPQCSSQLPDGDAQQLRVHCSKREANTNNPNHYIVSLDDTATSCSVRTSYLCNQLYIYLLYYFVSDIMDFI